MDDIKLRKCPFCGGEVTIGLSDDEGNHRQPEYEQDPWSGLAFQLVHQYDSNKECPIACHPGEHIGILYYDSRHEAAQAWNNRFDEVAE